MVCGSYPEFYWIPCELDCFQIVPLLRIVLTSSASLLLSCFPHESVAVLSSAASLRICHGQICTLSKHTCLHISCQAGLLSYLPYLPSSKGVENPLTQQETNESASKSEFMVCFFEGGWEAVLSPRTSFPLACGIETS